MEIRPLSGFREAQICASMMCSSEPWVTLGRTYDESLALLQDTQREVYTASEDPDLLGFIVLNLQGPFVGYIQIVCVAAQARGRGVGTELLAFAERRILRDHPNVFLCVSDFNPAARALYERLGYQQVGELPNFLVSGHSEILMRKSIAPIREFRREERDEPERRS